MTTLPDIDAVLFDIGGTLVDEAPPLTPVDALVARPSPGALDVLHALAGRCRLGAVTDTAVMDEADVRKLLAPVGIDPFLEVLVTSRDVGAAKPDPRGLLRAAAALGVVPERTLFVGDRAVDRDAAAACGMQFVAVDRGLEDALVRASRRVTGAFARAAAGVRPLDAAAHEAAVRRHLTLTKPAGSLGYLEDVGAQLAGIAHACPPPVPARPAVAVFAGDHGVVAQGVTSWPQDVTAQMVANFARGGAAVNAFARQVGAAVHVVDVGVAGALDLPDDRRPAAGSSPVHERRVRAGTRDLAAGPAMTSAEAIGALDVGAAFAADLVAAGHDLLVTGEMGIGNTTSAAALVAALTGRPAAAMTGRGTGIDDEMLARKRAVVTAAVARTERHLDPVSVVSEIGGLEIAALAGFVVGGAAARVPVLVDGVIAGAAACVAHALVPDVRAVLLAGHRSVEPAAGAVIEHLGLRPLLDLDLRLGEGTGACLAVPLVQAAARVLSEMATFDDLG